MDRLRRHIHRRLSVAFCASSTHSQDSQRRLPAKTVHRRSMAKSCWNSQPRLPAKVEVPPWWPKINKKPCTYLYRIMRPDKDDLRGADHRAMDLPHDSDDFVWEVLNAVDHGSTERSPFWHASTSFKSAQDWRAMADALPEHAAGGSHPHRVAIKIDVWRWYESGSMPDHGFQGHTRY